MTGALCDKGLQGERCHTGPIKGIQGEHLRQGRLREKVGVCTELG